MKWKFKGADAIYGLLLLIGLGMLAARLHPHAIAQGRNASAQTASQQTVANTQQVANDEAQQQLQSAFRFVQRQMTISTDFMGEPEPGLASLQTQQNSLCRMRCGFHVAMLGEGVKDIQAEFVLSDINVRTMRWQIDGFNRAVISFQTSDGSDLFWQRAANFEKGKATSWPKWEKTSEATCRAQPDKSTLPRLVDALAYIASACGAKDSPF